MPSFAKNYTVIAPDLRGLGLAICNTACCSAEGNRKGWWSSLPERGKTTMEIAKYVHRALRAIGKILNKVTGEDWKQDITELLEIRHRVLDLGKRVDLYSNRIW
jgi:hypothetical protein